MRAPLSLLLLAAACLAAAGCASQPPEGTAAASTDPAGASTSLGGSAVVTSSAAAGGGATRGLHKTGISTASGGGNGATAPTYRPGSDNEIVARRLKKAAEQETNPSLRAKLWKEYTDYLQGASAK